jgi:hypothetical protein
MRPLFALPFVFLGVFLGSLLMACSNNQITATCMMVTRTGNPPVCVVTAQCSGTNTGVQLDCSGNTGGGDAGCVCTENDITGSTVPYQSAFCGEGDPTNVSTMEDTLDKANTACGWGL